MEPRNGREGILPARREATPPRGVPCGRRLLILIDRTQRAGTEVADPTMNINELIENRSPEAFELHQRHLNGQMVAMLRTIGYDVHYVRAEGPYLFDGEGRRYLDMLSGFGVYALGRNHPGVRRALRDVLEGSWP